MQSLRQVFEQFPASRDAGLSPNDIERSRAEHGVNRLTPIPSEPLWKKFIEKFDDSIIKILLAAALLSMLVELFQSVSSAVGGISFAAVIVILVGAWIARQGQWIPTLMFACAFSLLGVGLVYGHALWEGVAVMVAIILATGVAFLAEYKSDREFEILNEQKESLQVKVTRDGNIQQIPADEVVTGDVVILEMGDEVPADGRIIRANELLLDQSLLTGESDSVRKLARPEDITEHGPDQPGCVYRGTQVVDGTARMVVVAVGDHTMIGQIAHRLSDQDQPDEGTDSDTAEDRVQRKLTISKKLTPLQVKLEALAGLISTVGYIAATAIFLVMISRGIYSGEMSWPGAGDDFTEVMLANAKVVLDAFVYMVIIIVVAVPEGLPMSVTVSLALAMQKMTRANSLVRQLVACETIGSATVICSDKTGTLTQNKMRVERVLYDAKRFDRDEQWPKPTLGSINANDPVSRIGFISAINSTANLEEKENRLVTVGNTTEGALLHWLHESGIAYRELRDHFPTLYQMHFSSERKRMTTVVEIDGRLSSMLKGAPEMLLSMSDRYLREDGTVGELTEDVRKQVLQQVADSAADAMRTLAFAYTELPHDFPRDEDAIHDRRDEIESGLIFIGFVAIRDPLRDDVHEAVNQCREAGIDVKMVTGDNIETARAIGKEIGLLTSDAEVINSQQFNALTDDQVKEILPRLKILARALPQDKHRLVRLLQDGNEVVAVTGDGTNDAPALKKADVGLAMGIAGTEVAKEASKIVLLDDAFSTIVKAVHWGRSLYENIQRFIQFQLTINVSALVIAFLAPLIFNMRPPFTVLQLLWINVIMDTFAAIALCSEPPRPGLMQMKPKRRDENILSKSMQQNILITALFFIVVMLSLLWGMKEFGWFAAGTTATTTDPFYPLTVRQVSIFFSVYVFFQVWNQINCRSLTPETSGLHRIWENKIFLGIASSTVVIQILITNVPFLARVFQVEPLGVVDWLVIAAATSSVLLFAEIMRRFRR